MLKSLIAVSCLVSTIGGLTPSRQYSHTENVGNTEVTYKYESNEVNSVADLIEGNIYEVNIDNLTIDDICSYNEGFTLQLLCLELYSYDFYDYTILTDEVLQSSEETSNLCMAFVINGIYGYLNFPSSDNNDYFINIALEEDLTSFNFSIHGIFILRELTNNVLYNYSIFSYTDYNEIESVTYTPPTTIIGTINEFCRDYLFKDIPMVNEITFTVGGQEITLMTYLVIIFGLITAVGLFVLLVYVFKWLFKTFANCFRPYK